MRIVMSSLSRYWVWICLWTLSASSVESLADAGELFSYDRHVLGDASKKKQVEEPSYAESLSRHLFLSDFTDSISRGRSKGKGMPSKGKGKGKGKGFAPTSSPTRSVSPTTSIHPSAQPTVSANPTVSFAPTGRKQPSKGKGAQSPGFLSFNSKGKGQTQLGKGGSGFFYDDYQHDNGSTFLNFFPNSKGKGGKGKGKGVTTVAPSTRVTVSPVSPPVSPAPTLSNPPSVAPVTSSPTQATVATETPTSAPISPTAPVTSSPTEISNTATPSLAPVTSSPTNSPVTDSPTESSNTDTPTQAPITESPTSSTQSPTGSTPSFTIELQNMGTNTDFDAAVQAAARRWERVVVGKTSPTPGNIPVDFDLFNGAFAPNTLTIEDLGAPPEDLIIGYDFSLTIPGVAGQARPVITRVDGTGVPISSVSATMVFNLNEIGTPESTQAFNVILHEIGHALGIGAFREDTGQSIPLKCWSEGTTCFSSDFVYPCSEATNAYQDTLALPGQLLVSSDCGHWELSLFDGVPYVDIMVPGLQPLMLLTALSVGAIDDLGGYVVDYSGADPLPSPMVAQSTFSGNNTQKGTNSTFEGSQAKKRKKQAAKSVASDPILLSIFAVIVIVGVVFLFVDFKEKQDDKTVITHVSTDDDDYSLQSQVARKINEIAENRKVEV